MFTVGLCRCQCLASIKMAIVSFQELRNRHRALSYPFTHRSVVSLAHLHSRFRKLYDTANIGVCRESQSVGPGKPDKLVDHNRAHFCQPLSLQIDHPCRCCFPLPWQPLNKVVLDSRQATWRATCCGSKTLIYNELVTSGQAGIGFKLPSQQS